VTHYCDCCKEGIGEYHITLTADIFGGSASSPLRRKMVQFWLCSACEMRTRDNLARDRMQRARMAKLLAYELDESNYSGWRYDSLYGK